MRQSALHNHIKRRDMFAFIGLVLKPIIRIAALTTFSSKNEQTLSSLFAEFYSKLWDYAEHSISHQGFNLPSAFSNGAVNRVNEHLCELYGSQFSSLSFGGSSGAMLTLLTGVFPKLFPQRSLILFDDVCHQSTIGGLIYGRWNAVRLPREKHEGSQTAYPIKFKTVKTIIEQHGPENFAAIILVLPSYDGFRSPSEDEKIYRYAKSVGIPVIVDGAWDGLRFYGPKSQTPALASICDVWITSPHKRGLTPSSLGCILTNNESIARLWDEALELGFRSSSISFLEIMIAEHRLSQIRSGQWNKSFDMACRAAKTLRRRIKEIHPKLQIITPVDVKAELGDPTHILISTQNIPQLDARDWAITLADEFSIDIEKATASSLLLLCGSPAHLSQIDRIISHFREALKSTLETKIISHDR